MEPDAKKAHRRAPLAVGVLAMLTLSSLFYYSDQLFASTYQTETPTPVPVVEVGDTTGLILFSIVIVIIILAGTLWPRKHRAGK
ncbi:MAG: hypothetical protein WHV44_05480 [Anaerolineales bacterium]